MAMNLLDGARGLFTADLRRMVADKFNEPEGKIEKGLDVAVPALLAGLIGRSERRDGDTAVYNLVRDASDEYGNLTPAEVAGDNNMLERGWNRVKDLYGTQSDNVLGRIASYSGAHVSSITRLLGLAAPMIFTWLGNYVKDRNLRAPAFAEELAANKESVIAALPEKLNMAPIFTDVDPINRPLAEHNTYVEKEPRRRRGGGFLIPLLLILGLAAVAWYMFTREDEDSNEEITVTSAVTDTVYNDPTAPGALDTATGNYVYSTGDANEIRLPDNTMVTAGNNSSEQKLFSFLNDSSQKVNEADKTQGWITLDRVYFETGKNTLTGDSEKQLDNIAAIMKAYPEAEAKLGGYTDNSGDSTANVKLSADRAKAAMDALVKRGINASRLTSEGYGPMHAIADNSSDEGKARNRRVDIRVTKK